MTHVFTKPERCRTPPLGPILTYSKESACERLKTLWHCVTDVIVKVLLAPGQIPSLRLTCLPAARCSKYSGLPATSLDPHHCVVTIIAIAINCGYYIRKLSQYCNCCYYPISPNLRRGLCFKYCFLQKRSYLIFGSLRINMEMILVLIANSNDICENV
jgi:hypothetical protein